MIIKTLKVEFVLDEDGEWLMRIGDEILAGERNSVLFSLSAELSQLEEIQLADQREELHNIEQGER